METATRESVPDAGRGSSRPPWQVIAALLVGLVAIGVAVVLGARTKSHPVLDTGPLPVATVDQPAAQTAACGALMAALPPTLAGAPRRTLEGGGPGVAAWGDPAVILRCGTETPAELTCSAALTQVDGVSWLSLESAGTDSTTYLAADRSVRIALTLPDGTGTTALQQVSDVVGATLPVRPPCNAGVLLPTDTR